MFAELYLTDIRIQVAPDHTFITPVGTGCHVRKVFKSFYEVGLICKLALISNGG